MNVKHIAARPSPSSARPPSPSPAARRRAPRSPRPTAPRPKAAAARTRTAAAAPTRRPARPRPTRPRRLPRLLPRRRPPSKRFLSRRHCLPGSATAGTYQARAARLLPRPPPCVMSVTSDLSLRSAASPTGVGLGLRRASIARSTPAPPTAASPFFQISPRTTCAAGARPPGPPRPHPRALPGPHPTACPCRSAASSPSTPTTSPSSANSSPRFGEHWHSDHICFCGTDGSSCTTSCPCPSPPRPPAASPPACARPPTASSGRWRSRTSSRPPPVGVPSVDEPAFIAELLARRLRPRARRQQRLRQRPEPRLRRPRVAGPHPARAGRAAAHRRPRVLGRR